MDICILFCLQTKLYSITQLSEIFFLGLCQCKSCYFNELISVYEFGTASL